MQAGREILLVAVVHVELGRFSRLQRDIICPAQLPPAVNADIDIPKRHSRARGIGEHGAHGDILVLAALVQRGPLACPANKGLFRDGVDGGFEGNGDIVTWRCGGGPG